jgi:hypothetical protein
MATYRAIAGVSEAVRRCLETACPRDEFPDARFELYQPADFQKPMSEGVSIYLYRIGVNTARRTLPPHVAPDGRRYRGPLPVDLFYAIGVWGRSVIRQQRLLGWCMRTLEDLPILPSGVLNDRLPEADTFRPSETVEIVCEPLTLADLATIWDLLKPNVPLFATYVVRMIPIHSEVPLVDGARVQTREFAGQPQS